MNPNYNKNKFVPASNCRIGFIFLLVFYLNFNLFSPFFHHHDEDFAGENAVPHSHSLALIGEVDVDHYEQLHVESDYHTHSSTLVVQDRIIRRYDISPSSTDALFYITDVPEPNNLFSKNKILFFTPQQTRLLYGVVHIAGNNSPPMVA